MNFVKGICLSLCLLVGCQTDYGTAVVEEVELLSIEDNSQKSRLHQDCEISRVRVKRKSGVELSICINSMGVPDRFYMYYTTGDSRIGCNGWRLGTCEGVKVINR